LNGYKTVRNPPLLTHGHGRHFGGEISPRHPVFAAMRNISIYLYSVKSTIIYEISVLHVDLSFPFL
jgi:hypothetical protein